MNEVSLYQLMTWFSPSYPIGSFSYSHGIEYAVEVGLIKNAENLKEWIQAILQFGTGRIDSILFKTTYEIFQNTNSFENKKFEEIIVLSNALKSSPELWLESCRQGEAALKILLVTYPHPALTLLHTTLKEMSKNPTLSIVFGIVCSCYKIPFRESLSAFLHSFAANLMAAGLKTIPLGQTDGQKIMTSLQDVITQIIDKMINATLEDIGGATPMIDWTSVKHETQYTRLFQS